MQCLRPGLRPATTVGFDRFDRCADYTLCCNDRSATLDSIPLDNMQSIAWQLGGDLDARQGRLSCVRDLCRVP